MTTKRNHRYSPTIADLSLDDMSLDLRAFRIIPAALVGAAAGAMLSTVLLPIPTFGPICGAVAVAILNGWFASRDYDKRAKFQRTKS